MGKAKHDIEILVSEVKCLNRETSFFFFAGQVTQTPSYGQAFPDESGDRVFGVIDCQNRKGWLAFDEKLDDRLLTEIGNMVLNLFESGIRPAGLSSFLKKLYQLWSSTLLENNIRFWVATHTIEAVVWWQDQLAKQKNAD